jgi:hypothetical protein
MQTQSSIHRRGMLSNLIHQAANFWDGDRSRPAFLSELALGHVRKPSAFHRVEVRSGVENSGLVAAVRAD